MLLPGDPAVRVSQLGQSVRLNKSVAKVDLSKLRTSCQLNYPESPSKHHVAPTVGGPPIEKPKTTDHLHPYVPDQLSVGEISAAVGESFIGNHTKLWSDWASDDHGCSGTPIEKRTGPAASPTRRKHSPKKNGRPTAGGRCMQLFAE